MAVMESAAMETSEDKAPTENRYDNRAMFCACHPSNLLSFAFSMYFQERKQAKTKEKKEEKEDEEEVEATTADEEATTYHNRT